MTYPNTLPNLSDPAVGQSLEAGAHRQLAIDVNNEVEGIGGELGLNPKAIDDTVTAAATPSTVANFLDMIANAVKALKGTSTWYGAAAATIAAIWAKFNVTTGHTHSGAADDAPNVAHATVTTGIHGVGASTVESATGAQTKVDTHAALTNPHSATALATADRIILRDAAGRAAVVAPSAVTDIALKSNVDTVQTNLTTHQAASPIDHPDGSVTQAKLHAEAIGKTTAKARAYQNASPQSIPSGAWTNVILDGETYDPGNNFASNQFVAPVTGYYEVKAVIQFSNMTVGTLIGLMIQRAGVSVSEAYLIAAGTGSTSFLVSDIIYVSATQALNPAVYQASGSNRDLVNLNTRTYFVVHLVST